MITLEEKIKLFEECGMTGMVSKLKEEKEMKAEVEKLTAMKLNITTETEIRKKICGKYWEFNFFIWRDFPGPLVIVIGLVIGAGAGLVPLAYFQSIHALFGSIMGGGIAALIHWILSWHKTAELESLRLENWTDKIPTGALYAVKEAKEKGLSDFLIYFPITENRHRLMTDPVIVGFYNEKKSAAVVETPGMIANLIHDQMVNRMLSGAGRQQAQRRGKMIEVFAWDDGKVYE